MDNKKGLPEWIGRLFKKDARSGEKKPSVYMYAAAVLVFGAVVMAFGNFSGSSGQQDDSAAVSGFAQDEEEEVQETFGKKTSSDFKTIQDYERYLETEMKDALDEITGVDHAKVVVYVGASEKKIYETNKTTQKQVTSETDKEGGKRTVEDTSVDEQLVVTKKNDQETPLVSETMKPQVTGVLVVAKGAENIQVKKWIIEAVTRTLDVPSHRVSVLPKK